MITVIDYGMGNIGSVLNMLKRIGVEATASRDPQGIRDASRIILPGVGAFGQAMANLAEQGLIGPLRDRVERDRVPLLGICLGMQLLLESSEEGDAPGFGWVPGRVVRFRFEEGSQGLKVPHMGWNVLETTRENPILPATDEERRFYFVHSYHAQCAEEHGIGRSVYGYPFTCAVMKGNVLGVQFHPEKSHAFGMELLRRFATWKARP